MTNQKFSTQADIKYLKLRLGMKLDYFELLGRTDGQRDTGGQGSSVPEATQGRLL